MESVRPNLVYIDCHDLGDRLPATGHHHPPMLDILGRLGLMNWRELAAVPSKRLRCHSLLATACQAM